MSSGDTVTGTVVKEAKDSKVGITFSKSGLGTTVIKKIVEDGLFSKTDLQAGFQVLTVNGKDVAGKSTKEVADIVREAEAGEVSVVAKTAPTVTGVVTKATKDTKVGIIFARSNKTGSLTVKQLVDGGLFSKTDIKVGYEILSINGTSVVGSESKEVASLIKSLEGDVTVVAAVVETPTPSPEPAYDGPTITGTVTKASKDAKVGIMFSSTSGVLLIKKITDGGLFSETDLFAGLEVVSVNGASVKRKSPQNVVDMIKVIEGEVTVAAKKVATASGTVTKESKESKCGIQFVKQDDGALVIKKIVEGGLFAATSLKEGQEVLSVNGVSVVGKPSKDVVAMIKDIDAGDVKLVVKAEAEEKEAADAAPTAAAAVAVEKEAAVPEPTPEPEAEKEEEPAVAKEEPAPAAKEPAAEDKPEEEPAKQEAAPEPVEPPAFEGPMEGMVTGTVTKEKKEDKLGIIFSQDKRGGPLCINTIKETGPFASTDLKKGMLVVSVNGKDIAGMTPKEVVEMLKTSIGEVSVIAMEPGGIITGTVTKDSKDDKVGIILNQYTPGSPIFIKTLKGKFGKTALRTGLQVVTVNGVDVSGKSSKFAANLLRDAEAGEVTIVAKAPEAKKAQSDVITGVVTKASADSSVGITLQKMAGDDGTMLIKAVIAGGLFSKTDLKAGMEVLTVNGQSVKGMSTKEAVDLLRNAGAGEVSITAKKSSAALPVEKPKEPEPEPIDEGIYESVSTISGVVNKEEKTSKCGILFSQVGAGPVKIKTIRPDGLFAATGLSAGMEVVNVNGIVVKTPKDAAKIIREAEGEVSVGVKPISLITGTVTKESKESPVGIAFSRKGSAGPFRIKFMREEGLFSKTDLLPGLRVVAINGVDITGFTPSDCATVLRESEAGEVSVTAHAIVSEIEKDSKDAMTGISFQFTKSSDCVRVAKIAEGGLFASTPVQVGQVVIAINGTPCPSKTKDAIHLIDSAEGKVTLVTCDYLSPEEVRKIAEAELKSLEGGKKLSPPPKNAPASAVAPTRVESLLKSN